MDMVKIERRKLLRLIAFVHVVSNSTHETFEELPTRANALLDEFRFAEALLKED